MPAESAEPADPPPAAPPPAPESLALADDFPTPTREQWLHLVSDVVSKSGATSGATSGADTADPLDALSYTTYDGIRIRPLYTAEDAHGLDADGLPGHPPFVRGATEDGAAASGWDVRARHADPDASRANGAVLTDLERGATSIWLALGRGGTAVEDLPAVLEGVYLDLAPIVLDAGADTERAVEALFELASANGVDPAGLSGSFGADPIGARARTGAAADLDVLTTLAGRRESAPKMCIATVDATVYHEAGASDAQELGLAASVGVAYLRALVDGGTGVDDALAALEFRYAVTAEQFPSIAKLRAARRIWARVAELCEAGDARRGQRIHAVTSAAMLTQRDPWVNMLRTTIACFAAAVGAAESITVLPFDAAIGQPDDLARRVARNTHAVLHDESSLARVVDAAGGSWFVESLTDELAGKAWDVFTSIESAGGALAALDAGTIDELLAATRAARDEDIAHRRVPITGVSEFAFVDEAPVERAPLAEADDEGALLPSVRYAQDFEALRDRADAAAERPTVFLAGIGPVPVHSARVGFATNLFAAGGLEPVVGVVEVDGSDGDASVATDDAVAAFRESGSTVACLCSSDRLYGHAAAAVAAALREAGAERIWLAGKQADIDGVDGYVYAGCDALSVLRSTFETLGVK